MAGLQWPAIDTDVDALQATDADALARAAPMIARDRYLRSAALLPQNASEVPRRCQSSAFSCISDACTRWGICRSLTSSTLSPASTTAMLEVDVHDEARQSQPVLEAWSVFNISLDASEAPIVQDADQEVLGSSLNNESERVSARLQWVAAAIESRNLQRQKQLKREREVHLQRQATQHSGRTSLLSTEEREEEMLSWLACPMCKEVVLAAHTLACSHTMCGDCLASWLERQLTCPICRAAVRSSPYPCRLVDNLVDCSVQFKEDERDLRANRLKAFQVRRVEKLARARQVLANWRANNHDHPVLLPVTAD